MSENITPSHPTYRFEEIAVYNAVTLERRPDPDRDTRAPSTGGFVRHRLSHSVLAALSEEDTRAYFSIFRRYLKPGGRVFLTAFVEEDAEPVTEAYPYPLERGARRVTLWSEEHLYDTMSEEGFVVDRLELHIEITIRRRSHLTLPE